jgi:hypothetical protein
MFEIAIVLIRTDSELMKEESPQFLKSAVGNAAAILHLGVVTKDVLDAPCKPL